MESSYALAQSGRWKGQGGVFTVPFESRGATALAALESVLPNSSGQLYSCKPVPAPCKTVRVPKELASVVAKPDKLTASFKRAVQKMPATYTTCE